ncbi:vanadium-dependent haloperoxidase [Terrimonas pollutisoli]|uniref:vanadium-dependent haloperoxidase n=1 Tax=Terrimonas pollutisoli TaxID=3034147 RepID=UPI0023EADDE4|nr:vanadium-dependent haloperoxidase [Terrimonas sp. H1YJ31]
MKNILGVALLGIVVLSSCKEKAGDYKKFTEDPLLYSRTVKKLNDVVLENNFPPMIATRNYAYANIAAYETMAAGNSKFQSLSGQVKHLPAMPKPEAGKEIDFSLASLFSFCKVGNAVTFPEGSMMGYYDELKEKARKAGMTSEILKNTIAFSDTVVAVVLKWSKGDNYAQTRSAEKYTVKDEEGRWIPTPPMYAQAVEPKWNSIRCLTLDSCSQFMPPRPPLFNIKDKNSEYLKYLNEVKNIGDSLTEEQKHIADFWDDNPFKLNVSGHVMFATKKFSPAGHWMNIVGIAAKESKADFATTVAAYTETSVALFDAFISCWDEKFRSNYVRPETAINKYLDEEWRPYIQTPPFPSYTSGHATISAAAAEVMTDWFGDKLSFTDTSSLEFGIESRRIVSFREAAKEAAMSRLYGGIHYRFDNEQGNVAGRKLGDFIIQRLKLKKENQLTNNN